MKSRSGLVWLLSSLALGCASTEETQPPAAAAAGSTQGSEAPPVPAVLPATPATPAAATTPAKPPPTTADLVKHYQECWGYINAKQWEPFTQCYAENATSEWLDSGMPTAMSRADLIEKQTKPFMEAFPDFHGDLQLVLANGHTVLSLAIVRGTHEATLMSPMGAIPATHKKIGLLVAHVVELNDQMQVTKEWYVQDFGTMMAQLGLSPAPARPVIEKNWPETPVVIATGSDTEKTNMTAATQLDALFSSHDKAGIVKLVADDVVDYNPSFPKDLHGKVAMGDLMAMFFKGFSDVKADVKTVWSAGDYAVSVFSFGGTNDGPAPTFGIKKPTGKKFALQAIEISKWESGKLKALWPMFNSAALAGQLGLMPPPSAAAPTGSKPAKGKAGKTTKPAAK